MLTLCQTQKGEFAQIVAEILWSVANCASDTESSIDSVLSHRILAQIIDDWGLVTGNDHIMSECVMVISNLIVCGTP